MVFVSTLGTTEACAIQIRRALEAKGDEVVVFHTAGAGGKAMEEILAQEKLTALVDHRFGGDYDAGADRGKSALKLEVPTILIPGNIAFLVSGPVEIARCHFPDRPYHMHNAAITVVRTTREELEILAKAIGDMCNQAAGPLKIFIPTGGFSAFDGEEGPLHDPEGPQRFVIALNKYIDQNIRVTSLPCHINDAEFSAAVLAVLDDFRNP